jgi:DUF4097 and DUF4098 domain-containing protein YvlB
MTHRKFAMSSRANASSSWAPTAPGRVARLLLLTSAVGVVFVAGPAQAGSPFSATRTDKLSAPGPVTALELTVLNGDVRISAGAAFAATVVLKAGAQDQASADALLARTKVNLLFDRGEVKLETPWEKDREHHEGTMVDARYDIVLPAAAALKVRTVNAGSKIDGIAGPVTVDAVNGPVDVSGVKKDLRLRSVNGKVEGRLVEVSPGAKLSANTVNGSVTLWVPPGEPVQLSAQTMNGDVVSTLPLPPATISRPWGPPQRNYKGTIGAGTIEVDMKSVNGRLALMGIGSTDAQAKPLVVVSNEAPQGGFARIASKLRGLQFQTGGGDGDKESDDIRRDMIAGDFVLESGTGDVRVDAVSGRVSVKTSGDVRIGAVAKAAEVYTAGGDIRLDAVKGGVQARSGGGDVRLGEVGGDARVETQGGDVRVNHADGMVTALTRGGDITLRGIRGAVKAQTAGGDITVEMVGKEASAASEIITQGGDVTLILPENFKADVSIETKVQDPTGRYIRSDFPELAVVRGADTHTATGKIGGGGAKLVVRSQSGEVTVKKGPAVR